MNRRSIRSFPATLTYYHLSSDHLTKLVCLGCHGFLDIHQPNQQQPERFLATCPGCGRWYRVDAPAEFAAITVLELPEIEAIPIPATTS